MPIDHAFKLDLWIDRYTDNGAYCICLGNVGDDDPENEFVFPGEYKTMDEAKIAQQKIKLASDLLKLKAELWAQSRDGKAYRRRAKFRVVEGRK
jgi:hypothetical protein